jgi:hypothetical protein
MEHTDRELPFYRLSVMPPLEYDPDTGQLILERYLDGAVREAVEIRAGLVEAATRDAVVSELRRFGYTVTPPTEGSDG